MIKIVNGDVTLANEQVIAHQVNLFGLVESSVALAIKDAFPEAIEKYREVCANALIEDTDLFGANQQVIIPKKEKIIVNMFCQIYSGQKEPHINYDALEMCFMQLARKSKIPIAMPYKLGCGRSKGDWEKIIYPMIQQIFKNNDVVLYRK